MTEVMALFSDLTPMNAAEFRAEQDRYANTEAHFDAYSRHQREHLTRFEQAL